MMQLSDYRPGDIIRVGDNVNELTVTDTWPAGSKILTNGGYYFPKDARRITLIERPRTVDPIGTVWLGKNTIWINTESGIKVINLDDGVCTDSFNTAEILNQTATHLEKFTPTLDDSR